MGKDITDCSFKIHSTQHPLLSQTRYEEIEEIEKCF